MKRLYIASAILLFWLVMMGWLVRYEAFPGFFSDRITGYDDLLEDGPLISDSWMKILIQDIHVGYSHSHIDIDETDPSGRYRIESQTLMNLNILGAPQRISVNAEAALDALYSLQRFSFSMSSGAYQLALRATRLDETRFNVTIRSPGGTQKAVIEIPPDAVLYSPMMETALKNLKPGQEMRLKVFDPTSLSAADLLIRGIRNEILTNSGQRVETTLLAYEYEGMEIQSWLDVEGTIIRQETPLGWTMEAATPDDAVDFDRNAPQLDLLRSLAIPVRGILPDSSFGRPMRIVFSGGDFSSLHPASHRQQVLERKRNRLVLESFPERLPKADDRPEETGADRPDDLASTLYVQADHPDIVRQAKAIVHSAGNDIEKARAIYDWVHTNIRKNPTASLPSAVDVLRVREGDCNEHTYLFVALARAAGLPARIRIGVVFMRGAFYYHAWPAVQVGRWMEMDPTLGQPVVDATHVALLSGELTEQMKLLAILGRTQAEILNGEE